MNCLNNELNTNYYFVTLKMRFNAVISCHYTLIRYMIIIILKYSEFYFQISDDSMKRFKIN